MCWSFFFFWIRFFYDRRSNILKVNCIILSQQLNWIERFPSKENVGGSSPSWDTLMLKKMETSGVMDSSVKLIRDTTDNTSSELGTKITELINEARVIKKQVDTILRGYVPAKDSDFKWKTEKPWNGAWHYIGKR